MTPYIHRIDQHNQVLQIQHCWKFLYFAACFHLFLENISAAKSLWQYWVKMTIPISPLKQNTYFLCIVSEDDPMEYYAFWYAEHGNTIIVECKLPLKTKQPVTCIMGCCIYYLHSIGLKREWHHLTDPNILKNFKISTQIPYEGSGKHRLSKAHVGGASNCVRKCIWNFTELRVSLL